MSYQFVPVQRGSSRRVRRMQAGSIMGKLIMILAVIAFIAFLLHGGIFLLVPLYLIGQLFRRRPRRRTAQRQTQRVNPNAPYSHL